MHLAGTTTPRRTRSPSRCARSLPPPCPHHNLARERTHTRCCAPRPVESVPRPVEAVGSRCAKRASASHYLCLAHFPWWQGQYRFAKSTSPPSSDPPDDTAAARRRGKMPAVPDQVDYDSDGEPILSAEQQQQAKQAARRHEAHGGGLCLNRPPSTPKASSLSPPQLSASQLSPSALQKGEKEIAQLIAECLPLHVLCRPQFRLQ